MPKCQKGGGTDAAHGIFYGQTAVGGPAAISAATLQVINNTPMFNPFSQTTVIPGSSGIIPVGLSLMSGGGTALSSMTIPELRSTCNDLGMSCKNQKGGYLNKCQMIKKIQNVESIV